MSEWYEKTIGHKKVRCRTVKSHARNTGRTIEREMCYEIKPDGTKGRLVHSGLAGKSDYSLKQLRDIERSRPARSRARDEATTAETVISTTSPRVNSWVKNPSVRRRIDINGIDTAGGVRTGKRVEERHPRKKTESENHIVCKTVKLPDGRTTVRCRDTRTGEYVKRPRSTASRRSSSYSRSRRI